MRKNWDDKGNWIGDDLPDSTTDWGVDYQKDVESGTFALGVGVFSGLLWFIIRVLAPAVLIITGIVWVALKILGVM